MKVWHIALLACGFAPTAGCGSAPVATAPWSTTRVAGIHLEEGKFAVGDRIRIVRQYCIPDRLPEHCGPIEIGEGQIMRLYPQNAAIVRFPQEVEYAYGDVVQKTGRNVAELPAPAAPAFTPPQVSKTGKPLAVAGARHAASTQ